MNRTVQVVGGFDRNANETALVNLKLQVDGSITKIKASLTHYCLLQSLTVLLVVFPFSPSYTRKKN
jgi:hypothetical protein